jgi:hypothetical protein
MLTLSGRYEKIYLTIDLSMEGLIMSDVKTKELEKNLSLKMQEIESLKSQNGRLIERLQEEIDKSSTSTIQKEIIHKEIIQIHLSLREVFQQDQIKKSILEKVFAKMNEFESRVHDYQKTSAAVYGKYVTAAVNDELEHMKLEVIKMNNRSTGLEKLMIETKEELDQTRYAIDALVKHFITDRPQATENLNLLSKTALVSEPSDDRMITDEDVKKISLELKNELGGKKEDLNLILQMLSENK